jgi:hypothetical protein
MEYCVRVNFPDADLFAFITHECGVNKGKIKKFTNKEDAEATALKYAGGIALPIEPKTPKE